MAMWDSPTEPPMSHTLGSHIRVSHQSPTCPDMVLPATNAVWVYDRQDFNGFGDDPEPHQVQDGWSISARRILPIESSSRKPTSFIRLRPRQSPDLYISPFHRFPLTLPPEVIWCQVNHSHRRQVVRRLLYKSRTSATGLKVGDGDGGTRLSLTYAGYPTQPDATMTGLQSSTETIPNRDGQGHVIRVKYHARR